MVVTQTETSQFISDITSCSVSEDLHPFSSPMFLEVYSMDETADLKCQICGIEILAGIRCIDCFSAGKTERPPIIDLKEWERYIGIPPPNRQPSTFEREYTTDFTAVAFPFGPMTTSGTTVGTQRKTYRF